jgi:hypothetical protein
MHRGAEHFIACHRARHERVRFDLALVFRDAHGAAQISYFPHVF